jgi:hypothetical protein
MIRRRYVMILMPAGQCRGIQAQPRQAQAGCFESPAMPAGPGKVETIMIHDTLARLEINMVIVGS